ncbi:MAG: hypothetical protein ACREBU_16395, partial [Nitrososphaera sp.]
MVKEKAIIFADENVYEKFLNIDGDVSELEKIGERLGPILTIDSVYDSMRKKLPRIRTTQNPIAWSSRLFEDNKT